MLSSLMTRVKNAQISKVEISFLILLLIFGTPMIVLVPPGAGYDEEDHLVRVWELSAFSFIPGQISPRNLQYPTLFRDFAYRQQGIKGIIDSEFWQKYARASLYEYGSVRREINTKSVYSPPLLFPQAIVMRIFGRTANLPALPVFYASRFASLISYLILVGLAIRLIPFGKWILLVLAASPMALFQATTISPDAISNGIGFLFIAGCLRATEFKETGWKECGYLLLLIFVLFLGKLNLLPLVLLPFLLIPPSRFTNKRIYFFLLGATGVLFLVEAVGWYMIASTRSDPLLANDANPAAQLRYILDQPFTFPQIIIKDLITNGWTYFEGWINGYGYYYWTPPQIVSFFFLLGLGAVVLMNSTHEQVDQKFRIIFIFIFVTGYLATVGAEYTTFTPVGSDQIFGIQGRYFIPLSLLLFLALASFPWTSKIAISSSQWIIIFLSTALLLNLLGLLLSFHVPCGSTFYQTGLCYQPLYRDFTADNRTSQPLSNEITLTQEIRVACDGLAELRVLLIPSSPEDKGITRFILQDSVNGQTLTDSSIANNQIITYDWYPLSFNPEWHSTGKQYILEILSTNTSPGQGLKLLYTTQSEFDLGNLYENRELVQEDIVLQYGCVTGIRKLWLTGRP
jgi:uncharacterized membrane protein